MGKKVLGGLYKGASALLLSLLLCALILTLAFSSTRTLIGGWAVPRNSRELDLRDLTVRSDWGLRLLRDPRRVDLRGSLLSAREMLRLTERFPDCEFLWEVPVGTERFDSRSLSITPASLSKKDLPAFALFSHLEEVDGRSCGDIAALHQLQLLYPQCRVLRCVPLGSRRVPAETEELTLPAADADFAQLMENLAYFPALRSLRIVSPSLREEEAAALRGKYPGVDLDYEVETVCGRWFSNHAEEISLTGCEGFSLGELREALARFPGLRCVDLTGCGFSNEELCRFRDSLDGVDVRWSISLYGATLCTTDSELDLSGQYVQDVGELEALLPCFPHVEKVLMCECGVKDEVMDALDRRHEDIRFVWTVHFGAFFLRTDATTFIATTFPYGYSFLTNKELEALQYCRDLIALDLGHMEYSDVSFLRSLPKLQYLILADTHVSDISMLAEMKDLRYLELFLTDVRDISPLLECKNLRHLNLAYCVLDNAELLGEMPWLERLWIPGVGLNARAEQAIRDNLGNTKVERFCSSSTGGSWRTDAAYFEMRDVFGVYYMPG